jgi:hypothetical protein
MGFLWAILMPILIVASGIVVRYAYSIASGNLYSCQTLRA